MLPHTTHLAILIHTEIFHTHGAKLLNAHKIRYALERSITTHCVLRCFEIFKNIQYSIATRSSVWKRSHVKLTSKFPVLQTVRTIPLVTFMISSFQNTTLNTTSLCLANSLARYLEKFVILKAHRFPKVNVTLITRNLIIILDAKPSQSSTWGRRLAWSASRCPPVC